MNKFVTAMITVIVTVAMTTIPTMAYPHTAAYWLGYNAGKITQIQ